MARELLTKRERREKSVLFCHIIYKSLKCHAIMKAWLDTVYKIKRQRILILFRRASISEYAVACNDENKMRKRMRVIFCSTYK